MKSFMDVEAIPTIPHLIEEVPNFKDFIKDKIAVGENALLGHTKAQQFIFYADSTRCCVMKFKLLCTDDEWLLREGGIKLWKEDASGNYLWPRGSFRAVCPTSMQNLDDIKKGLQGFINHWEQLSLEDATGEYCRRYEPLYYYWRRMRNALDIPLISDGVLKDGFWPTTRVAPSIEDQFTEASDMRKEFDEDEYFVGQAHDRPSESFRINHDLYEVYFLAIRPSEDDKKRLVWIVCALSKSNCNPEHLGYVLIQYLQPMSCARNVQESYVGWDSTTGLWWKEDATAEEVWENTNFVLWKSGTRKDTISCMLKIPPRQIQIIQESLASASQ